MDKIKNKGLVFIVAIAGAAAVFFIVYRASLESSRSSQIDREINSLREEAEKIKKSNLELGERVAYFETPEFQEKVAKDKLNLQKEGEEVVIIKQSPSLKEAEKPEEIVEAPKSEPRIANYKKWWNYFFE